jgi:CMP-N,N'-diacetyllegionaminic acid synthase
MKAIALIPARAGSVGIKHKNIAPLAGRPLIAHSIEYALSCPLIDRVIVSTDSAHYAEISRSYGAETPFLRPAELGQNDTPDLPVFQHCLRWLKENEGYEPDLVIHLRPTAPLRPPGLIERALDILENDPEADCVRAVCTPSQSPFKMWKLENGYLVPLMESSILEAYNQPRQSLPQVFWQNAYLDAIRTRTILGQNSMTGRKIKPLLMQDSATIDIDGPLDLAFAQQAFAGRPTT